MQQRNQSGIEILRMKSFITSLKTSFLDHFSLSSTSEMVKMFNGGKNSHSSDM